MFCTLSRFSTVYQSLQYILSYFLVHFTRRIVGNDDTLFQKRGLPRIAYRRDITGVYRVQIPRRKVHENVKEEEEVAKKVYDEA